MEIGNRFPLFWDFMHHRMVVPYWCFETTYWSHHQRWRSKKTPEDGTKRFSWNVGMEPPFFSV